MGGRRLLPKESLSHLSQLRGHCGRDSMSDNDPAKRVAAFEAIVSIALEEAQSENSRWYGRDVERADVEKRIRRETDVEVSTRTVDRALKDAESLDWIVHKRKGYDSGRKAEQWGPAEGETENPV